MAALQKQMAIAIATAHTLVQRERNLAHGKL
jgi:hypothetical protein